MKVLHTRARQVLDQIDHYNRGLSVEMRAEKYQRMAESPFIFFRGSSHLYWYDVSRDWRVSLFGGRPETQLWLQGDAHIYNFGALHDHQNRIYFGMDDFDDAIVGDFQFDLWRLAASMVLDLREREFATDELIDNAVKKLAKAYLKTAAAGEEGNNPALRIEHAPGPIRKFLQKVHQKNTRQAMLQKWTTADGLRLNPEHPKLGAVSDELREEIIQSIPAYLLTSGVPAGGAEVLDIARRLQAGTGSLGSLRYYLLVRDQHGERIILDVKQQREPSAVAALPEPERCWYRETFTHEGRRHAQAFAAIAEHPDRWLGWMQLEGRVFSVRERSPFKKDYPAHKLDAEAYLKMATVWGEVLASEHVRGAATVHEDTATFSRFVRDSIEPEGKAFVRLLRAIAPHYARCVEQDWRLFCASAVGKSEAAED